MRPRALVLTLAALLLWLVVSWFVPNWLHVRLSESWILRLALTLLGLAGAVAFLWFYGRKASPTAANVSSRLAKDLDLTFAQAAQRLNSANFSGTRIGQFPVILLVGDTGAAKTTVITHSGLDPELLAGQAADPSAPSSTPGLNLWLAKNTVVIDPAGALLADRAAALRLSAHLAPPLSASLTNREPQPRSVIVCVSCQDFLQPNAATALAAKGRQIREQLSELAGALGVALPVYVLFTKADLLSNFPEYASTLSTEEAQEVLGATLPFLAANGPGVPPPTQGQIIANELARLFYVLSDRRTAYLTREHDPVKAAAIYEFPRDFRKLQPLLQSFLGELSRPLQLQLNPILRGFYFTGVRPLTVTEYIPAPSVPRARHRSEYENATSIFVAPPPGDPGRSASPAGVTSRRVPQWVYLNRLFPDVILADRTALDSSKQNVKTGQAQRLALLVASLAGLVLAVAWTTSFLANYQLLSLARNAVESANSSPAATGLAPKPDIEKLTPARTLLGILQRHSERVPFHMRWGLYAGHSLDRPALDAWFSGFRRTLLAPTQAHLVKTLAQLKNSGSSDYGSAYNALKAYLITTSFPEKNTLQESGDFLAPELLRHWLAGQSVPPAHASAASAEFAFYGQLLRQTQPWPHSSTPDSLAVTTARNFLNSLSGIEPVYQQVVSRANQEPPLIFNRLFPGSERLVVNSYPVPAAFTKAAWASIQTKISKINQDFRSDDWVLGPAAFAKLDTTRLQQDLQTRYKSDYAKHWREYLRRTSVPRFNTIKEAAAKLTQASGNQSPILQVLCLASENTSVDPAFQNLFEPPRQIVPPGCTDHLSSPPNDPYVQALIALQASLATLATDENNDGLRSAALQKATDASVTVSQPASKFTPDKEHVIDVQTRKIMEAPILYVRDLIGSNKGPVNAAAADFCSQSNPLLRKYPFSISSPENATIQEVNTVFAPGQGALWTLYQNKLQKEFLLSGTTLAPRPGSPDSPNAAFVTFFNRMARISDGLYHGGADLKVAFDLRVIPDPNVLAVSLSINGQALTYSAGNSNSQHFTWPASGNEEIKLQATWLGGSPLNYPVDSGAWDLFRFFSESESWQIQGNEYIMEKPLRSGNRPMIVPATGRPATVRFGLTLNSSTSLLKPGALSGPACVSTALR